MPSDSRPAEAALPARSPRWLAPVLAALIGFACGDALRPPADQTTTRIGIAAIDLYRATASRWIASTGVVHCRYQPTCSAYGREALSRYGWPRGFAMAAGRVLRCTPWAKGGDDPVR